MEYKIKPWAHQLRAIDMAKGKPNFALFFEMGAGKTSTVINILRHKMNLRKTVFRTLIFCPSIVIPNWKEEFKAHSYIDPSMIHLLNGSGAQRLKLFEEKAYKKGISSPGFFITNYQSLLMEPLFKAFQNWGPDALIFDESHKLKNYQAKSAKAAFELANPSQGKPHCYLLSGSPILNSPMDIFQPYKIMDGGETFGKNFFMFRGRYFRDKNAGMPKGRYFPDWVPSPGSLNIINSKIYKTGMRVTKLQCLDLPEEVAVTLKCKISGQQLKNYMEMVQDFITFVGDQFSAANLAIVKALRLMQITSGFLPLNSQGEEDDTAKIVYEKTEKEAHLEELLEELTPHSKVLVWAVWKENYAKIKEVCDRLSLGYVEVHGGIGRSLQDENVRRFKEDKNIRVFIGHPGSGGIGINLTCAPYSIFYSRTFSLEQFLQARARNHRGGQLEKVTHYDLVCENTIDELVQKKLAEKISIGENILRDIAKAL